MNSIKPAWWPEYAFLVIGRDGSGQDVGASLIWPIGGDQAELWLWSLGAQYPVLTVADAKHAPYEAHYTEAPRGGVTYEVRRVTVLPLA
ncbi:hypothetical protein [Streptomyces asiaticus]|uniref:hypothetical protein n=1 Tax=Streptomyces asiaticus TaxID=114695 RepID=UPI003F6724ED